VGTAGAAVLAGVLGCGHSRLAALDLSQNDVAPDGIRALTAGLRANGALGELSLSVRVGTDAAAATTEVTLLRTPGAPPGPWRGHANARVLALHNHVG
jgi:hypothetical protein